MNQLALKVIIIVRKMLIVCLVVFIKTTDYF